MSSPSSPVPDERGGARAVAEPDAASVRRTLGAALVRAGAVDERALARADRLLAKLGDGTLLKVLSSTAGLTRDAVLDAVRTQRPDLRIGTLLVELGFIGPVQLRRALQLQAQMQAPTAASAAGPVEGVAKPSGRPAGTRPPIAVTDGAGKDGAMRGGASKPGAAKAPGAPALRRLRLGELLVARRLLREVDLTSVLAAQLGVPCEEPEIGDCERALLEPIPLKTLERFRFLPVRRCGAEGVVVAFVDTGDQNARTEAARAVNAPIVPVMMSAGTFERAFGAMSRRRERGGADAANDPLGAPNALVGRMLAEAIAAGASDVHIEPLQERVRVRVRVDGILRELLEFPSSLLDALVSRLKIMAEADIAERRRHQDGRIVFEDPATGSLTDLRASFYVTVHGECAVLRVLNQANRIIELEHVGMTPAVLRRFREDAIESPSGVVVVTGPTGSGKTSTLYSCVHHLNDERTSIITAEDPVEYRLDGISQCSLAPKIGRTFAESLRHIVRQDPDVIVLGEIRDASSAESAIQAALTGHKVLTTFHTEDAVGALLRFMNMDIEPFLIASTIECVVAQRLLRRVCPDCARPMAPDPAQLQALGWQRDDAEGGRFVEGAGCAECHFTGYRGRLGTFEVLLPNEAVREAVLERGTSTRLRRICLESAGLVTLLEDGLAKAARGDTTLAEVRRTLPRPCAPRPLQEIRRLAGLR